MLILMIFASVLIAIREERISGGFHYIIFTDTLYIEIYNSIFNVNDFKVSLISNATRWD